MAIVVTCCRVTRNPTNRTKATGKYDQHGNAFLVRVPDRHRTGEFLEIEEGKELDYLRKVGAVRDPTEAELALRSAKASATEFVG